MSNADRDEAQIKAIAGMTAAEVRAGLLRYGLHPLERLPLKLRCHAAASQRPVEQPSTLPVSRGTFPAAHVCSRRVTTAHNMGSQPSQQLQNDWPVLRFCAAITLLSMFISVGVQILMVPPAWWAVGLTSQKPVTPAGSLSPTPMSSTITANVCGEWLSVISKKRYKFTCRGQDSFEIYEVTNQGLNKSGSGKLSKEGDVIATLISSPTKGRAGLRLKLSNDRQKLEGLWRGEDSQKAGHVMFQRIYDTPLR